ncbi:hypothetical protein HPB50_018369 [Hyalomma asiaticum]|uniref:Uncharacterized protein n=1 Tax=Hyalomma asiaticum TaxID=266040 RepID=A0ACB7TJH2_HYAAI|nr:hypothetical protein HPB50_018369 [Hyalomma asiaticum]
MYSVPIVVTLPAECGGLVLLIGVKNLDGAFDGAACSAQERPPRARHSYLLPHSRMSNGRLCGESRYRSSPQAKDGLHALHRAPAHAYCSSFYGTECPYITSVCPPPERGKFLDERLAPPAAAGVSRHTAASEQAGRQASQGRKPSSSNRALCRSMPGTVTRGTNARG